MNSSSKYYDEKYEYNAPNSYFDFTTLKDDENVDSYFDCLPESKQGHGSPNPATTPERAGASAGPLPCSSSDQQECQDTAQQQVPEDAAVTTEDVAVMVKDSAVTAEDVAVMVKDAEDVAVKVKDAEDVAVMVKDAKDVAVKVIDAEDVAVKVKDAEDVAVMVKDAEDVAVKVKDAEDVIETAEDATEAAEESVVAKETANYDALEPREDAVMSEGDAAMSEGDAAMSEGDAAMSEGDAAMSEDAVMTEVDAVMNDEAAMMTDEAVVMPEDSTTAAEPELQQPASSPAAAAAPEQDGESIEAGATPLESMETEDSTPDRPVTRSCRKGPMGTDGVFLEAPMRHSPRLAAIAKVLSTSSQRHRNSSPGSRGRRRSISAGPVLRRRGISQGPAPHQPRVAGGEGSLTAEECSHLSQYATLSSAGRGRHNSSSRGGRLMPTKPKEFVFATDSRLKSAPSTAAAEPSALSAADFARSLRQKSSRVASKPAHRGPTVVQPFKLSESKRGGTSDEEQQQQFVSMAQLNMKFHCQTPDRFKTKPSKEGEFHGWHRSNSSNGINKAGITRPQSPSLSTRGRTRSNNHPTREQVEEQELQEALQHKFKSRPLNPKVFDAPKLNAVVSKKLPTIPQPFDIKETKKEKQLAASHMSLETLMDDSSLAFPHGGVPFNHKPRTRTRVQPFSFHDRDQNMLRNKQQKIQQTIAREKEMAEFHAHPMPEFEGGPKGLPDKRTLSPTKPQPFDLQIEKRGQVKKNIMDKENSEREAKERVQRQFHARPATVTIKKPFLPQPSNRPATEIAGFDLQTEKRSGERMDFDVRSKIRESALAESKRLAEEQRQQEEEARLAEERHSHVHKARPMPQFPVPQVQPSDKHVTVALSPNFATDSRLRSARSKSSVNSNSTLSLN